MIELFEVNEMQLSSPAATSEKRDMKRIQFITSSCSLLSQINKLFVPFYSWIFTLHSAHFSKLIFCFISWDISWEEEEEVTETDPVSFVTLSVVDRELFC